MASGTTLNVLVVLIVFFGFTFGLYGLAVSESSSFFVDTMSGGGPTNANLRDPTSLLAWNKTDAVLLSVTNATNYYDINGWSWTSWKYETMDNGSRCLLVETYNQGWLGLGYFNQEDLLWLNYSDNSEDFSYRTIVGLNEHWVMPLSQLDWLYGWHGIWGPFLTDLDNLKFTLSNAKGSFAMRVTFNTTKYSVPSLAAEGDGLYFSINQDFSDRQTSVNLIDFISGLFTFENIGIPEPINSIVSWIWYGCIGALSYIVLALIRSFIPLVSGE